MKEDEAEEELGHAETFSEYMPTKCWCFNALCNGVKYKITLRLYFCGTELEVLSIPTLSFHIAGYVNIYE